MRETADSGRATGRNHDGMWILTNSSGSSSAAAIAEIREHWMKNWNSKQLEEIASLYTPNAVFLPSAAPGVIGRQAIHDLFKRALETSTPHIDMHSIISDSSGNIVYDSGDYTEMVASKIATQTVSGSYLIVLKRQVEGKWLIVRQMWTALPHSGK